MALKTKYSPLQKMSLENVFNAYQVLSPQNKLVATAIGGIAVLCLLLFPLTVISRQLSALKKDITTSQKSYRQVSAKVEELEQVKTDLEALEATFKKDNASLTSKIEGMARDAGLTVSQLKEKPAQETDFLEINTVEVKISQAALPELMDFFYKIEHAPNGLMRIRKLELKTQRASRQHLDVTFEVATLVLKKEA